MAAPSALVLVPARTPPPLFPPPAGDALSQARPSHQNTTAYLFGEGDGRGALSHLHMWLAHHASAGDTHLSPGEGP